MTGVPRPRVLLSLSLSLFSQLSYITWHSQFLCTARSPRSLHPHTTDVSLLSNHTPSAFVHPALLEPLASIRNLLVSVPFHSLSSLNYIPPCIISPRHLDGTPPTLDRPNIAALLLLSLHSPWLLSLSLGIPHQLYLLRARVMFPSI